MKLGWTASKVSPLPSRGRSDRIEDAIRVRGTLAADKPYSSAWKESPHPARTLVRATFSRKGRGKEVRGLTDVSDCPLSMKFDLREKSMCPSIARIALAVMMVASVF